MLLYNVIRSNTALSTSADFMTIISNATRSFGIIEIDAEGDGTSSGYNEAGIYRVSSAGTTGSGAITPSPINPALPAAGFTVDTAWTGQPTVGALVHNIPINANGQRYFWRAMPNLSNVIWSPGGAVAAGSLSVRSVSGTANISLRLQIGEI